MDTDSNLEVLRRSISNQDSDRNRRDSKGPNHDGNICVKKEVETIQKEEPRKEGEPEKQEPGMEEEPQKEEGPISEEYIVNEELLIEEEPNSSLDASAKLKGKRKCKTRKSICTTDGQTNKDCKLKKKSAANILTANQSSTRKGLKGKSSKVLEKNRHNSNLRSKGKIKKAVNKDFEDSLGDSTDEQSDKNELPSQVVFTCDICNKMIVGIANLKDHQVLHIEPKKPKVYKCSYEGCSKEFKDSSARKKHVNAVHLNIRNFLCEFCVARFKTLGALKVHILCWHTKEEDKETYNCQICDKTFLREINLRKHLTVHSDTKQYICTYEGCARSFRLKATLNKHVKIVHKDWRPFQCQICQEKFTRSIYLETHMYKHTGIKNFSCEVCGKFFSQKGNLRVHMSLHSKNRPSHECPVCLQTFSFKSNLTKHLQKHA